MAIGAALATNQVPRWGRITAWAIGLAPLVLLLATWSEPLSHAQRSMRSYALPVLLVEIAVVLIAIPAGASFRRPPTLIWTSLLALLIVAWATALTAPYPLAATERTALWMIHLLYGISLARLAERDFLDTADLTNALLAGFLVFSGLLVVFVASVTRPDFNPVREFPAFSNIRWFGYYAAAAIGLAAWGFTERRRLHMLAAAVAFAMAFWTGSRGAVFAAVAGFAVAALLFPAFRKREVWLRFLMTLVMGLVLGTGLDAVLPLHGQGPERMALTGGSGRVELWVWTLENILRRPWFGWGEAQVAFFSGRPLKVVHPHNIVLQVVHAWGIVGAVLLLVPSVWLARLVLDRTTYRTLPLACTALVLTAFSLIDGTLYHVHALSIFAACVAITAASPHVQSSMPSLTAGGALAGRSRKDLPLGSEMNVLR